MNTYLKHIISLFTVSAFLLIIGLDISTSFGFGLFVFFIIKFFQEIGTKIEIRDIMILLASLQWIIGPFFAFSFFPDDEFYYMAVDLETYMSFVVPATISFSVGLYLPIFKRVENDRIYLDKIKSLLLKYKNIDITLIAIGIVSELIIEIVPTSIRFLLYLFSGTRFIGLYFLFISDRKNKMFFVYILLGWLVMTALRESLFHDLLLWFGFFLVIVAFINKPSTQKKIIFSLVFFVLGFSIQTVKYSYREAVSEGENSGVSLFSDLVQEKVFNRDFVLSEENISSVVTRINQGWIIARIMGYTPSYEPFAEGETIKEALKASLMPRFLFPDKIKAGGRTYFERFTGKEISEDTSMGLSLLGEAYANYGILGGAFFMFIIGVFYNFFLFQIYRIAKKHPSIIFFIPLIFLQVIKAETDFSVILNHLIKASVAVWMIYWGLNRFFRIKL